MQPEQTATRAVFVSRLVLGLAQGLALYLLYSTFDHKSWPATVPELFAPLVMVALYVPLIVLQGLGNLRARTLGIWTAAAVVMLAGLSFYDIWRAWPGALTTPSGQAFFVCAVFLFVAHALVSCGDADRKIVANYPTLFDLAWKLGVQIAIAACFVLSFWLMVWLGIALFDMIKLTGFGKFIEHPWVWIPLTTLATAVSIHVTDTKANLVRGVRTLALTLLGWLLPVIALISFAFLISLMVTGLQPLFETRAATFLLMAAAAVLVIHINAVYQDGNPDQRPHHILRVAGTLAAVLLIFIVTIAAYALWLRVNQYGWTADRITSAAAVLIAAMFAVGYLIAAILPGQWLKLIERWNVYGTFLFLIVLLALSTPLADPMRLSVADQVARLNAGAVKADKFDFWYLRRAGRIGHDALETLAKSGDKDVRTAAIETLNNTPVVEKKLAQVDITKNLLALKVYPQGRTLPGSFLAQHWTSGTYGLPWCFSQPRSSENYCDAILRDFDSDGAEEVMLVSNAMPGEGFETWFAVIYRRTGGEWVRFAEVQEDAHCPGDRKALVDGRFEVKPPEHPLGDISIGGRQMQVGRMIARTTICPPAAKLGH